MIQDSGERRQFETGAVRDIQEGKGRCDLLPLKVIGIILDDRILTAIGHFMTTGDMGIIADVIVAFGTKRWDSFETALLEVAVHYEEGAKKYKERNWEEGIDCHSYVDSAVRHYIKYLRGDDDEPHDRAFLWNLLGLLWTLDNKPELNDLPFNKEKIV